MKCTILYISVYNCTTGEKIINRYIYFFFFNLQFHFIASTGWKEVKKGQLKNIHSIKTRVKYIVSYFNNSLIQEYAVAAHKDLLVLFLAIYITIKWLEATDFALHILARFISRDSRIYLKRLLIALLLSSMRRSQSDVTDVHSKTWLTADVYTEESPKYKNINNLIHLEYLDDLQIIIILFIFNRRKHNFILNTCLE